MYMLAPSVVIIMHLLVREFISMSCTTRKVECSELIREKVSEAREALLHEFDDERSHHQKMMSDYTRLQQRFENLQGDMQLLSSPSSNLAPFACQQLVPMNNITDSVISEVSDAAGDNVSLDGTQTVSPVTLATVLSFFKQIISYSI